MIMKKSLKLIIVLIITPDPLEPLTFIHVTNQNSLPFIILSVLTNHGQKHTTLLIGTH